MNLDRILYPRDFSRGHPGRGVQARHDQIHERQLSIPVLVISQWQNASEMRAWFSRYFTELASCDSWYSRRRINVYQLSARELEILRFMVKG